MCAIAVLAFLCAFPAYFGTNGVVAYVAVTSIATIGLYIAYAIPIYLRLRAGDAWEPGEWNLGRRYKPIGSIAIVWVAFICVLFILPIMPAGIPFKQGLHVAVGQLRADRRDRDDPARRRLVDALGATSGSRARSRRAPRRSWRGSRRSTSTVAPSAPGPA